MERTPPVSTVRLQNPIWGALSIPFKDKIVGMNAQGGIFFWGYLLGVDSRGNLSMKCSLNMAEAKQKLEEGGEREVDQSASCG